MSWFCARAFRSTVSSARAISSALIWLVRIRYVQPSTALSGARSSCDTVARKRSLSRLASSACASARFCASYRRTLSIATVACAASASTMRSVRAVKAPASG